MSLESDDAQFEVVERAGGGISADTDVSTTVVTAVARASGTDPTELPPLYEHVDPEALNALVTHNFNRPGHVDLTVTFTFNGYDVVVSDDGEVVVSRPVQA